MSEKVSGANLGFEKEIFAAADKLRGNIDAAEYKNVVLGLIFLKYISDSFEERYKKLQVLVSYEGRVYKRIVVKKIKFKY